MINRSFIFRYIQFRWMAISTNYICGKEVGKMDSCFDRLCFLLSLPSFPSILLDCNYSDLLYIMCCIAQVSIKALGGPNKKKEKKVCKSARKCLNKFVLVSRPGQKSLTKHASKECHLIHCLLS